MAELADALDSKSSGRKAVWVRAPPPAGLTVLRVSQRSTLQLQNSDAARIRRDGEANLTPAGCLTVSNTSPLNRQVFWELRLFVPVENE